MFYVCYMKHNESGMFDISNITEYSRFYHTVKYQGFSNNLDGNSEKDDNWCNWQHALPIRGNNGSIP